MQGVGERGAFDHALESFAAIVGVSDAGLRRSDGFRDVAEA